MSSGHTASCRCGQLSATVTGEPVRVSVCHCLNCKKRSGSAFTVQARWPSDQVRIEGGSKTFGKVADSGNRATFHFCANCGSDVYYEIDGKFDDKFNGLIAIPGRIRRSVRPAASLFRMGKAQERLARDRRRRRRTHRLRLSRPRRRDRRAENSRPSASRAAPVTSRVSANRWRSGGSGRRCYSRRPSARR